MKKNPAKSFKYFTKSANAGPVRGNRQVGWCLSRGWGTDFDLVEGAKYYKAAAEGGDGQGRRILNILNIGVIVSI